MDAESSTHDLSESVIQSNDDSKLGTELDRSSWTGVAGRGQELVNGVVPVVVAMVGPGRCHGCLVVLVGWSGRTARQQGGGWEIFRDMY